MNAFSDMWVKFNGLASCFVKQSANCILAGNYVKLCNSLWDNICLITARSILNLCSSSNVNDQQYLQ